MRIDLIRRLSEEGGRIFTIDQARQIAPEVGINRTYVRKALHHLKATGWVVSLRRGLYAISPSAPGVTPAHEFEIAMALVTPSAISHWSAMSYHGLSDQTPRKVFVLTTTGANLPRTRTRGAKRVYRINEIAYEFVQIKRDRYFGIEDIWLDEAKVKITNVERTLLDGLMTPNHCGGFAEVLRAFDAGHSKLNLDRIIEYSLRWSPTTAKRLGWVLDHRGIDLKRIRRLAEIPTKGYRKLDPTGPQGGPYNRQWMIRENLPGNVRT